MLRKISPNIIIKFLIILAMSLILFNLIDTVSYANMIKIDADGNEKSIGVNYPGVGISHNRKIYFEELSSKQELFCTEHGVHIPSRYSASNPEKDSTVSHSGINQVVEELNGGNNRLQNPGYDYTNSPNAQNPYGPTGSDVTWSHTVAIYNTVNRKTLSPAEAWVEAHKEDTSSYPGPVQQAVWPTLQRVYNINMNLSTYSSNPSMREIAKNLVLEAQKYEEALARYEAFKNQNNGNMLKDTTNYKEVKPSYNSNRDTILVGPFTMQYVREMYKPSASGQSKMTNSDGVVSYMGIVDAKLYADDAKTIEVRDWRFVYPQIDAAKNRTALKSGDEAYRYPYPGEPFYIEFPKSSNVNIDSLQQLDFRMENKVTSGETYQLQGTYNKIAWSAEDDKIVCTNGQGVCIHGIVGGHTIPYRGFCPPIYCSQHRQHRIGDGHLKGHVFYIKGRVQNANLHAQNLEEVIHADIVTEYNNVQLELGAPKEYSPFFLPIPIIIFPRGDEHEDVPVVPDPVPDPNEPEVPPEEPDNPDKPEIPLTFNISGHVWRDNPSGKETLINGIMDSDEERMAGIEVYLYRKDNPENYIASALTDRNGYYIFQYVKIGYEYYVDFVYDGMTYKTTKYLNSEYTEYLAQNVESINQGFKSNPESYLDKSHAIEDALERDLFNSKFATISNNVAVGTAGMIPLSYKTWMSPQGAVSALITTDNTDKGILVTKDEFKMHARTSTTDLYFPLDKNYNVDDEDKNLVQVGDDYYYVRTYKALENINLGLVKREQGDFAVKNDVYQTIVTMKGDLQTYKYNDKPTSGATYDVITRTPTYYIEDVYKQQINPADHSWRYDSTYGDYSDISSSILSQKDELNVYIEYKFLIRNQSPVQFGEVLELSDYFDEDLEYADSYDFTNMSSWIETNMSDSEDGKKEQIIWKKGADKNGYTKIYTHDLKDKILVSGQTLELHLILKVKKDDNRSVIMDLNDKEYKENILEISTYAFNEGLIDRDSNPGSVILGNLNTYEDDTDTAPLVKLIFTENYGQGRVLTGYAWEDFVTQMLAENNLYTGNGLKEDNEKKINDIKVELIEVLMNQETGEKAEVLRKTASGTDFYRTGEDVTVNGETISIEDGQYKFTNLDTGTYKVKFTYGDEYQLSKDITYNGQDYKTVSTDTLIQQYKNPSMEVMLLVDSSNSMAHNGKAQIARTAAKQLIENLYSNVQTIKIGASFFSEPNSSGSYGVPLTTKPGKSTLLGMFDNTATNVGSNLATAVQNAIDTFGRNASSKTIVICTDGYIKDSEDARNALTKAEESGIRVIVVACSTDEWPINTFGSENSSTAGKLYYISGTNIYKYLTETVLEDILLENEKVLPNLTDGKDIQDVYKTSEKSKVGDIYSRKRNMDYSTIINYDNASVLDIESTVNRNELANKTQLTSITSERNVMISHDNARTQEVNLGLIERPKVELQVKEEVSRIKVTLSNGKVIIDTEKDLTQNVQLIANEKYAIYLDDEIMQGATLEVQYKITVFNNGHVDTLGEYFDYNMFDATEVSKYTGTVPTKVGTLYNYYSNLTFRAEENNRQQIDKNDVKLNGISFNKTAIKNWKKLVSNGKVETADIQKVVSRLDKEGRIEILPQTAIWEMKNSVPVADDVDDRLKRSVVKVIQTNSLKDIELYPTISKEVLSDTVLASVSTYVQFSKVMSPQDPTDTLTYKNSVEIVERLNDLGRRDYIGVSGNYIPNDKITEYDSSKAEDIVILNPLGDQPIYYALTVTCIVIFIAGVIFIQRKVLR